MPTRQVRIVDPDTLEPVPLNTTGELLVTSEYIVKSYWNKPEETAASYVEIDGETWYKTKDYVRMDAILQAIQRYKATVMLSVPALYRMILENDRLDLYDLSSLRYCWSGGDVLPLEVYNRWKQKFHVPIYQNYGSTEVGCVA